MFGSLYMVATGSSNWVAGPPLRISILTPVFWPERGSTMSATVRSPLMSADAGSATAYNSQWSTSGYQSVCTTRGFGHVLERSAAAPPPLAVVAPPAALVELVELLSLPHAATTTAIAAS